MKHDGIFARRDQLFIDIDQLRGVAPFSQYAGGSRGTKIPRPMEKQAGKVDGAATAYRSPTTLWIAPVLLIDRSNISPESRLAK